MGQGSDGPEHEIPREISKEHGEGFAQDPAHAETFAGEGETAHCCIVHRIPLVSANPAVLGSAGVRRRSLIEDGGQLLDIQPLLDGAQIVISHDRYDRIVGAYRSRDHETDDCGASDIAVNGALWWGSAR